jgi:hypothetical protein
VVAVLCAAEERKCYNSWPGVSACPLSKSSVQNVRRLRKSAARFRPAVPTTSASTAVLSSRSDRRPAGWLRTCLCLATQSRVQGICPCLATRSRVQGTCLCLATGSRVQGTCLCLATGSRVQGTCLCLATGSPVQTVSPNQRVGHGRGGCPVLTGVPARHLPWGWHSIYRWHLCRRPPVGRR